MDERAEDASAAAVPSGFVQVQVEEHDALPEGCSLRFKTQGAGQRVERVVWESEDGTVGTWHVQAARSDGARAPATALAVDDSSAGTSVLIVGSDHGLRLTLADPLPLGSPPVTFAEPYLLVSRAAVR